MSEHTSGPLSVHRELAPRGHGWLVCSEYGSVGRADGEGDAILWRGCGMTRATIHFRDGDGLTRAIVYRHCDGYPEGLGKDLEEFFDELSLFVKDHRFWDAEYLAAKWVVWDSRRYSEGHPCDFLSVGIMLRDPADIAYRYVVRCGSDRPVVSVS